MLQVMFVCKIQNNSVMKGICWPIIYIFWKLHQRDGYILMMFQRPLLLQRLALFSLSLSLLIQFSLVTSVIWHPSLGLDEVSGHKNLPNSVSVDKTEKRSLI